MSDLTALFQPRAVAVIGASDQPGKLGRAMADSIAGFPGRVSLVNPRAASGMVPTIAAAAESGPVDLAILCVPAPVTSETLRECAEAGVRGLVFSRPGYGRSTPRAEGEVLHPAREDAALLARTKRELGSANFSAQYLQKPIHEEGALVKPYWFVRFELAAFDASGGVA